MVEYTGLPPGQAPPPRPTANEPHISRKGLAGWRIVVLGLGSIAMVHAMAFQSMMLGYDRLSAPKFAGIREGWTASKWLVGGALLVLVASMAPSLSRRARVVMIGVSGGVFAVAAVGSTAWAILRYKLVMR